MGLVASCGAALPAGGPDDLSHTVSADPREPQAAVANIDTVCLTDRCGRL